MQMVQISPLNPPAGVSGPAGSECVRGQSPLDTAPIVLVALATAPPHTHTHLPVVGDQVSRPDRFLTRPAVALFMCVEAPRVPETLSHMLL